MPTLVMPRVVTLKAIGLYGEIIRIGGIHHRESLGVIRATHRLKHLDPKRLWHDARTEQMLLYVVEPIAGRRSGHRVPKVVETEKPTVRG